MYFNKFRWLGGMFSGCFIFSATLTTQHPRLLPSGGVAAMLESSHISTHILRILRIRRLAREQNPGVLSSYELFMNRRDDCEDLCSQWIPRKEAVAVHTGDRRGIRCEQRNRQGHGRIHE